MNVIDTLGMSAEIAIELLGFTALALSLLPIPFLYGDMAEQLIWACLSLVLELCVLSILVLTLRSFNRINSILGAPTNWPILVFFTGVLLITVGLCFLNAVSYPDTSFALYLAALIITHIVAAALFLRLLVVWLTRREST